MKLELLIGELLVVGFIALGFGLGYIIHSSNYSNYDFSHLQSDIPEDRFLSFHTPHYVVDVENNEIKIEHGIQNLENNTYFQFELLFKTKDVFSVDNKIDYKIFATVKGKPCIKDLILLIDSSSVDYSLVNSTNFEKFIDNYRGQSVIDLDQYDEGLVHKEDTIVEGLKGIIPYGISYFKDESFFTIPVSGKVSFKPFVVGSDDVLYQMKKMENVLEINPAYTKLQAESTRINLENIKTQSRNNDLTLGLSLIIVGGIPLTISTQVILSERKKHDGLEKKEIPEND